MHIFKHLFVDNRKKTMATLWVILLVGVMPLVIHNGYYDCATTKLVYNSVITFIFGGYTFAEWWMETVKKAQGLPKIQWKSWWKNLEELDKAFFLFLGANVVSFLFSGNKEVAFSGCVEDNVGFFWFLVLFLIFGITRFLQKELCELGWKLGCILAFFYCLVVGFALLQFLGFDLFGIYGDLHMDNKQNFLSTIGNTSLYGLYINLVFPSVLFQGLYAEKKWMRYLVYVVTALEGAAILSSNTDATYLGFGTIMCCLIFLWFGKREEHDKFWLVLFAALSGMVVYSAIYRMMPGARRMSAMGRFIVNYYALLLVVVALCLAFSFLPYWIKRDRYFRVVGNWARVIVISTVVFVMGSFFFFSVIDTNRKLGGLEAVLRFTDSWGTDRGYVWSRLWEYYSHAPFYRKAIGFGQGNVGVIMLSQYWNRMIEEIGYYFNNAHNVYLHYLISTGLVGLLCYLNLLWSAVHSAFSKRSYSWIAGVGVGIVAYAAMDMVSIQQTLVTPILFFMLAMVGGRDGQRTGIQGT